MQKPEQPKWRIDSGYQGATQDKDGFIWFATYAGLYRYNSHPLKRYRHDATNRSSISSDMLQAVFCDSRGNVWIGGIGGLDLYNRDTDSFVRIEHDLPCTNPELNKQIYFISEDKDKSILVGTPFGLNRLTLNQGKVVIVNILHRMFEGPSQDITCVGRASNQDFRVGSLDGLIHVPANGTQPRLFRQPSSGRLSPANRWNTLHIDKNDCIWLGSNAGGLVLFDISKEEFRALPGFRSPDGALPVVTKILPGKDGTFWIAAKSGFATFDPESRKADWYVNQLSDRYSLVDNLVQSMCLDRAGGVWLGTYYFGISYFYPASPRFPLVTFRETRRTSVLCRNLGR